MSTTARTTRTVADRCMRPKQPPRTPAASKSYRSGLFRGWHHARQAANTLDVLPTAAEISALSAPSDLNPDEYREGYRDGMARHAAGLRSPSNPLPTDGAR